MELIIEQFELDMDILQSKYERVNEDLEFLIRKCDMKYIAESGTEDDLTALYTEANEQANEKKKNIFQKMLEGIKAFIQKIIGKIKGKKDKIEDDKEYEVSDISNHLSESKKLSSELKSAINSKNPEKISAVNSKIKKLKTALGIGAGIAVATTVILKKKKMRGSELKRTVNEVEKVVVDQEAEIKRISNMIDNLTDIDNIKEIQDAMTNLTHVNLELVNKLTDKQYEITDQKREKKIKEQQTNLDKDKEQDAEDMQNSKDIIKTEIETTDQKRAKEIERQKRIEKLKEDIMQLNKDKEQDAEDMQNSKDIIKTEIEIINYTLKELDKQRGKYKDKVEKITKELPALKQAEIIDKVSNENNKLIKDVLFIEGLKISVERLLNIPSLKISDDDDIYKAIKLPRNEYVEKYRRVFIY